MKKIYYSHRVRCFFKIDASIYILGVLASAMIVIIGFDIKHLMFNSLLPSEIIRNTNSIILNVSYSILSAIIFYIIVNHIPYYKKWVIYNNIIIKRIDKIRGQTIYVSFEINSNFNKKNQADDIIKFLNPTDATYQDYIQTNIGTLIYDRKVEIDARKTESFINLNKVIEYEITEILKLDSYINSSLLETIEAINSSQMISILNSCTLTNNKYIISEHDIERFAKSFCNTTTMILNIDLDKLR